MSVDPGNKVLLHRDGNVNGHGGDGSVESPNSYYILRC